MRVLTTTPPSPQVRAVCLAAYRLIKAMTIGCPKAQLALLPSLPTFVAMAEYENPLIDVHSVDLISRLTQARRRAPPHMWLREHNHTSIICHFNTADDALGRQILAFMAEPR